MKNKGVKPGIALIKDAWDYFFQNSCPGIEEIY